MYAAETHNLFSMQKFPYSAVTIIASFTFYTAHIIYVSNGCYIIKDNSDM